MSQQQTHTNPLIPKEIFSGGSKYVNVVTLQCRNILLITSKILYSKCVFGKGTKIFALKVPK